VVRVDGQVADGRLGPRREQEREGLLVRLGLQFGEREAEEELVAVRRVPVETEVTLMRAGGGEGVADVVVVDAEIGRASCRERV